MDFNKAPMKTHVFFQDPDSESFSYGNGQGFTSNEVDRIISLLPPGDKVVRILWADPENYVYPGDNRHEKISE
jgi:hypothetical protein